MKETLEYLFSNRTLTRSEATNALTALAEGKLSPAGAAAFLAVYRMRSVTAEELKGFRDAMLAACTAIDLSAYDPVDLCGTGGDGKETFNISTLAAFVVAGAGYKVAKHGNYGVSSVCGSSNLLEKLGVGFTSDRSAIERRIERAGICFLHAPLFHPAMKNIAPVRRDLGVRTFFNILGPLVSPARPRRQLVGVPNLELFRLYGYVLQDDASEYRIVTSLDGYDEVSLTGRFKISAPGFERLMDPSDLGLAPVEAEKLAGGGSIEEAARIFDRVLDGEGSPEQTRCVCANAALAIHCAAPASSLSECFEKALESLMSKRARAALKALLEEN